MAVWSITAKCAMGLAVLLGADENDSMVCFVEPLRIFVLITAYFCDKKEDRPRIQRSLQKKAVFYSIGNQINEITYFLIL